VTSNDLTNALLVTLPDHFPGRFWRSNVGMAYGYDAVQQAIRLLRAKQSGSALQVLVQSRPITFGGLPGLPDIDGIIGIRGIGCRVGVEVKAGKDRQRDTQKTCQEVYERYGAIYVLARDVEGCIRDLHAATDRLFEQL
jgi:hypothetical protein